MLRERVMKWLAAVAMLFSVSVHAACWTVEGVKGSSYSEREGYSRIDDGFNGKFTIVIDGERAAVLYDGLDAGGMIYRPFSDNVVLGLTTEPGKHAMETWVIQKDGTVLMTKTISGFGGLDSSKAMIGKVTGNCLK